MSAATTSRAKQNVELSRITNLSPEIAEKAEAFVTAMIAAGHNYREIKRAFNASVALTWIKREEGNLTAVAKSMGVERDRVYRMIRRLNMQKEVEEIRRGIGLPKNGENQ